MSVILKIVETIQQQGIKQKYVAAKLGWTERKLSAVLTGRRKLNAEELRLFCIVLNKEPNDFIETVSKSNSN